MKISLGNTFVGKGFPTYIVFEAGPTHNGLDSAKKLAKHAKEAGANAIKFQIADHHSLIADKALMFSYNVLIDKKNNIVETVTEPLIDIWDRRYMPESDWRELKKYCDSLGIDFFATVFSEDLVDFVEEIACHSIKIASQDINYYDLICYAAKKQILIQIDTGSATIGEVERTVDWIREEGNEKIIINHCPSGYPARLESINLKVIQTLQQMFPYPIAFSDHTPGWEMDIAAVAMGANIIELSEVANILCLSSLRI
jgi:sialic acid synthase SpsE